MFVCMGVGTKRHEKTTGLDNDTRKVAATLAGMTRTARAAPPGYVYHVLNRAVARLPLF